MKIGILTQKLENNYGGILQNFALQTVLKRLGHSVETIDFRPGNSKFWYYIGCIKSIINRKKIYPYLHKDSRSPFTSSFIEKNIRTSGRINVLTPILPVLRKYDCVVVGSDQVWREKYNVLRNTFLSFVPFYIKKISYAASFGVSCWEYSDDQTDKCRKWIKRFSAVSTREKSGVDLCNRYLHIKAEHVLDPTMLLTKDDYYKLCESVPVREKRFLFAYILDLSDEKEAFVKEFAVSKELDVVLLSAEKNISNTVESWLSYFRDATFVITDSFHGTVFSIINNKPFNVIVNTERGSDRFDSLLEMLDLKDRIIKNKMIDDKPIDWDKVSLIIDKRKECSMSFLINNL